MSGFKNAVRNIYVKAFCLLLVAGLLSASVIRTYEFFSNESDRSLSIEALFETNYLRTSEFQAGLEWSCYQIVENLFSEETALSDKPVDGFEYALYLGTMPLLKSTGWFASMVEDTQNSFIKVSPSGILDMSEDLRDILGGRRSMTLPNEEYIREKLPIVKGNEEIALCMVLPEAVRQGYNSELVEQNIILRQMLSEIAPCIIIAFLLSAYLLIVCGRKPKSTELHTIFIDRIYSDVLTISLCFVVPIWIVLVGNAVAELSYSMYSSTAGNIFISCSLTALTASGYILSMWLIMSIVRKLKARIFFKSSFCGKISMLFHKTGGAIALLFRSIFNGKPFEKYYFATALFKRQRTYILLSILNVAIFAISVFTFFPFALIALFFELYLTYRFTTQNDLIFGDMAKILDHVSEIEGGNLNYATGILPTSPLHPCDEKLNNIGSGLHKSVEKQMASERTKIDLVTNVSHDLKTPLTSIIGYIELLQKEELNDVSRDYVTVLAQKSEKLKNIVSDVFELAKSTSGNLEMASETLDFKRLVQQNLADMEDKIEASSLTLRVKIPDAPVMINADGRRLTRVLQNIIDNALNYSLTGSRIYVALTEDGVLTVINTSAYEMEFTSEEITERFVRGDKTRTDGGSGLGLSIAQSFTAACGGRFSVSVDGDQFKVTISFVPVEPVAVFTTEA